MSKARVNMNEYLVYVRGTGEIGSAIMWYLSRCGFKVVGVDTKYPTAVRRGVAFCEAISSDFGNVFVEEVEGVLCEDLEEANKVLADEKVVVMIDPDAEYLEHFKPDIVIDSIMSKGRKDNKTRKDLAPFVVGIGPGFTVGQNCDVAVESNRGHMLGVVYEKEGETPMPYTGVPGVLGGHSSNRVVRAPSKGKVEHTEGVPTSIFNSVMNVIRNNLDVIPGEVVSLLEGIGGEMESKPLDSPESVVSQLGLLNENLESKFGQHVDEGEEIMKVDGTPVTSKTSGIVRGLIREGAEVQMDQKIADVDPRDTISTEDAFMVSDKGRCIAGAVLHIIVRWLNHSQEKMS